MLVGEDMSKRIPFVTIIMSTYNGHKYIREQLESLVDQKGVTINLVVRDDGSCDDTISIIESFDGKFNHIAVVQESNVGATASFHCAAKLALETQPPTEYYAFCDQDDIWMKDKIISGIAAIDKMDNSKPNMYFTNLMMTNNDGEHLGMLLDDNLVSTQHDTALAAICTYGCTCIFNRTALKKFCQLDESLRYVYHDNWLYSVCSFLGNVVYDRQSHIYYRQTGHNVSGQKKVGGAAWIQRFEKLWKLKDDKRIYESIAIGLLDSFKNELPKEDIYFLNLMTTYRSNIKARLLLLNSKRLRTSKLSKNVCIIGRILLGYL